jgi:rod shape-determining protein MreC
MEREAPQFFNRGPTPLARLVFFVALAVACMVVDMRFKYLNAVRQSLTVLVFPLQQIALTPTRLFQRISEFFVSQYQLQTEISSIRQQLLAQSEAVQRYHSIEAELDNLKRLLGARQRIAHQAVLVEVVHSGRSPFIRKVVVDKGAQEGIRPGQAVIDATGVVGQVTAVYPFSSEVTLLSEKNQAVPVLVLRNGLRAVAFGNGQEGGIDLPFVADNADIRTGDALVTSGIDGTYPPGLAVATVTNIERNAAYVFPRISCTPSAGIANNKYMLVLGGNEVDGVPYGEPSSRATQKTNGENPAKPAKHRREE